MTDALPHLFARSFVVDRGTARPTMLPARTVADAATTVPVDISQSHTPLPVVDALAPPSLALDDAAVASEATNADQSIIAQILMRVCGGGFSSRIPFGELRGVRFDLDRCVALHYAGFVAIEVDEFGESTIAVRPQACSWFCLSHSAADTGV